MINELIAQGKTKEEIITIYMEQYGVPRNHAESVYAIETGAIDGDVIVGDEVPDDNNPIAT